MVYKWPGTGEGHWCPVSVSVEKVGGVRPSFDQAAAHDNVLTSVYNWVTFSSCLSSILSKVSVADNLVHKCKQTLIILLALRQVRWKYWALEFDQNGCKSPFHRDHRLNYYLSLVEDLNFHISFGFHHPYASNFVPLGLGGSVRQWQWAWGPEESDHETLH